jgi:hypothetical protein
VRFQPPPAVTQQRCDPHGHSHMTVRVMTLAIFPARTCTHCSRVGRMVGPPSSAQGLQSGVGMPMLNKDSGGKNATYILVTLPDASHETMPGSLPQGGRPVAPQRVLPYASSTCSQYRSHPLKTRPAGHISVAGNGELPYVVCHVLSQKVEQRTAFRSAVRVNKDVCIVCC